MKAGGGKRKGGNFENKMCKELSLWFSSGERDDLFTRTASSGGRFTLRKKTQKDTANQEGDITATTPEGLLLIHACCLEMKNGYKNWSIMDIIDKPVRAGKSTPQTFELFYQQACESSKWPVIIAKKDGRKEIIAYPREMHDILMRCSDIRIPTHIVIRPDKNSPIKHRMFVMNLNDFFTWANAENFKIILKRGAKK